MSAILSSLTHPQELASLFRFLLKDKQAKYKEYSDLPNETDPNYSFAICYYLLNKTVKVVNWRADLLRLWSSHSIKNFAIR